MASPSPAPIGGGPERALPKSRPAGRTATPHAGNHAAPHRSVPYGAEPPSHRPRRQGGAAGTSHGQEGHSRRDAQAPLTARGGGHTGGTGRRDHARRGRTAGATLGDRWDAGPAPARDADPATGIPRAAPPHPPCGRTGGSATAGARRGTHRPGVVRWDARRGLGERRGTSPQSAGGGGGGDDCRGSPHDRKTGGVAEPPTRRIVNIGVVC